MSRRILDFEDVRIEFRQVERVIQGEASTVEYELTNTGKAYLLFGFGANKYGNVSVEGDKAYHNRFVQCSTGPVFFFDEPIAPQSSVKRSTNVSFFQPGKAKHKVGLEYFKIDEFNVSKIFVYESERTLEGYGTRPAPAFTVQGSPVEYVYRSLRDLDELKSLCVTIFHPFLIPDQEGMKRTLEFELEIEVEPNRQFQELYGRHNPRDTAKLERWSLTALVTDDGTILLKDGEAVNIGYVELSALRRMEKFAEDETLSIWVKSKESGSLKPFLEKYGMENHGDEMYHGEFNYFMRLPKSELFEFFELVKKGKYGVFSGRGIMYTNEIWVLGSKGRLEGIYEFGKRGLGARARGICRNCGKKRELYDGLCENCGGVVKLGICRSCGKKRDLVDGLCEQCALDELEWET